MAVDGPEKPHGYYLYKPSHVLPAVFAALVAMSLILHTLQNMYVLHQCWVYIMLISP